MSSSTRTVDHDTLDFTRWLLSNESFQQWFINKSPEIPAEHGLSLIISHAPSATAKAYLDAIFAKEGIARSAWSQWSKEALGVDLDNLGNSQREPILLDAKGAEMLGLSRLEFASRSLVAREGGQLERLTSSEMSACINEMAESVVKNLAVLQRYDVIQIDDQDGITAKQDMFTINSDFWKVRASAAVSSALRPGVVLQRIVSDQNAQSMQHISWSLASIFTDRKGKSDITVSEIHSDSAKGGGRLLGSHYLSGNALMRIDAESFNIFGREGEARLSNETRNALTGFKGIVQSSVDLSGKLDEVKIALNSDPLATEKAGFNPNMRQ